MTEFTDLQLLQGIGLICFLLFVMSFSLGVLVGVHVRGSGDGLD